jgi:ornithine carbamoyltransferase
MASSLQQVTADPASWNRTSGSAPSSSLALVSTDQLTPEAISLVLQTAKDIRSTLSSDDANAKAKLGKCLHHKILSVISYTAAPRSDAAHLRAFTALGGSTLYVDASSKGGKKGGMTSAKKGETLADTLSCMECYGDLAVLRHWDAKAVDEAVRRSRKGLIVGNGDGEGDATDILGDRLFSEVGGGDAGTAEPEVGSDQQVCREVVRMAIYKLMLAT